jgi:hypothetical protein
LNLIHNVEEKLISFDQIHVKLAISKDWSLVKAYSECCEKADCWA